ncbi:MAG: type II toxin-antitoxin system VapC family toxin [Acidimicrobiales bacterium]
MTLALDTTGLLARYLTGPHREVALRACRKDRDWCASALALAEALMIADRVTESTIEQQALRGALLDDWQRIHVVPVDVGCLDRATELGRTHPVRTADAIHLAAADRLPRPVTYCTFDPRQIPVALALGFDVASV